MKKNHEGIRTSSAVFFSFTCNFSFEVVWSLAFLGVALALISPLEALPQVAQAQVQEVRNLQDKRRIFRTQFGQDDGDGGEEEEEEFLKEAELLSVLIYLYSNSK